MNAELLRKVLSVFDGSDGDATRALFADLELLGPSGIIAINLFRAQKSSSAAKVYRGGGYRGMAYDRKGWALDNLCRELTAHTADLGITWGWGEDEAQAYHRAVLYIDLPTGQVSFHSAARGVGPDYAGTWDGIRDASPGRVVSFIVQLLHTRRGSSSETGETASLNLA